MDIKSYMRDIGVNAKKASSQLASAKSNQKNTFLEYLSNSLVDNVAAIITANKNDLSKAEDNGLDAAFIDRLKLEEKNIKAMAEGLKQIHSLDDPIGAITNIKPMPSGIQVGKMRVPLGVIGMIFESRPNVTIDAAGLAIKSGNAIILRGGSESIHSNNYLAILIKKALIKANLPESSIQVIDITDRAAVGELITMHEFVDVIIPRGGKSLIKRISDEASIPVIKHLDGNCHIYVDEHASLEQALGIVDNAKTQRLGTCNTLESLVVHKNFAEIFLIKLHGILKNKNIELRGCDETLKIIKSAKKATEDDFYEEYLGPILSCKIVTSFDEAIRHINHYSSGHTEAIITNHYENSMRFLREIDSSSVMINASTRFADGFEYGLGAEIGISTDKFHARGPVGLEGLTSEKYIVIGNGQIRK